MSAAVKTTGFAGPGLKLSYKNKNALGEPNFLQSP